MISIAAFEVLSFKVTLKGLVVTFSFSWLRLQKKLLIIKRRFTLSNSLYFGILHNSIEKTKGISRNNVHI